MSSSSDLLHRAKINIAKRLVAKFERNLRTAVSDELLWSSQWPSLHDDFPRVMEHLISLENSSQFLLYQAATILRSYQNTQSTPNREEFSRILDAFDRGQSESFSESACPQNIDLLIEPASPLLWERNDDNKTIEQQELQVQAESGLQNGDREQKGNQGGGQGGADGSSFQLQEAFQAPLDNAEGQSLLDTAQLGSSVTLGFFSETSPSRNTVFTVKNDLHTRIPTEEKSFETINYLASEGQDFARVGTNDRPQVYATRLMQSLDEESAMLQHVLENVRSSTQTFLNSYSGRQDRILRSISASVSETMSEGLGSSEN
ncbi:hypothetical protein CVT26_003677, partial [Gymnopilus dilepis]